MPLDMTTFEMSKEDWIRKEIEGIDNPIERTQAAVWGLVQYVTFNKGRLQFFNGDTGLGKTTGFRQSIEKSWEQHWGDKPFLVMVPTRVDAENMWLAMEEVEEGCAGVWTDVHEPSTPTADPLFTPTKQFTKAEAASHKVLVVTHNAGKVAEDWVGRRDLVFVDEDPQPVGQETFERYHFTKAADDESRSGPHGAVYSEADDWAREQEEKGLSPVAVPAWVDKVLSLSPVTSAGACIQRLAQGINDGRAFQSRTRSTCWTVYKYDLPFQDRTIIFSATAHYEGFQFGSGNEFIRDLLPKVDYSNVEFKFKDWPEGLTKNHKQIMNNRTNRERFFKEIEDWVPFHSVNTLFVCPKDMRSDIEAMFPSAMVTNYGRDVGSNEFRDCTDVYIVSEFHMPNDALRANYLGHSGFDQVTEDSLDPIQNSQSTLMKTLKDANYSVHLKQMIARCALRNIDDDGKAGKATVHCMINEGRFTRLLPTLFPNSKLTYPERKTKGVSKGGNALTITKAIRYLTTVPEDQDFVGSPELNENGVCVKGKKKTIQITRAEPEFMSVGWYFRKGSGKGRGNPSGFHRLKGYKRNQRETD